MAACWGGSSVWWGGEHCPAGTPYSQQGSVEKTASYYAPMWTVELFDHRAYSGEIAGQPESASYQTLLEFSAENRTLSQTKILGYYWAAPCHISLNPDQPLSGCCISLSAILVHWHCPIIPECAAAHLEHCVHLSLHPDSLADHYLSVLPIDREGVQCIVVVLLVWSQVRDHVTLGKLF